MSGSKKVFTTLGSSNHVPEEREAFDYGHGRKLEKAGTALP